MRFGIPLNKPLGRVTKGVLSIPKVLILADPKALDERGCKGL